MSSVDTKKIITSIKQGDLKPIYFLMGEEAFFIDTISDYIEDTVLTEEEKGFNQTVFYGRDVTIDDIVGSAKRFPMMAERQVIIVKEAQDLSRTIENLVSYVENLQPTTVLVLCYKYKKLDARKKLAKAIKKVGVLMESKKVYDNQIPKWIESTLSVQGHSITPKASAMLAEYLGTDLGKINNELNKLRSVIAKGAQITPELVEENIGISKDYNSFELIKAIGSKNIKKTFAIAQYFEHNPKSNPLVMTIATLYGFFSKMLKYHAVSNKDNAAKALGVSPYFINDYHTAGRNFNMRKVSMIITYLHETDVKSKGVGSNASNSDLLKELLIKIFS
ncbi:DNA polymerase III subunit delta [Patiriisocius marinus]|uniref:DNA polymerase III subunit delta n=1 Tax=Patiriisocius marinus TaxID=1397112 RepID=A0A5J4J0A8_9FLAO|nr:DNA polymerase III subunit delta [Patiriisocius marinus]GER60252.1 DNA polymerase III subunit delta [Patiriisocius marinus]